jgi:surface polysaccharide O-acyltransferase-like enzyme
VLGLTTIAQESTVIQIQQRSTFVTVVAWIFIALSGFGTVIAALQNVMLFTVFRSPDAAQVLHAPPPPGMPPAAAFMASHAYLFFVAFLVVSAFTLISSVGLLRRWNWARLFFVGLMVIGVVWNLGGLALQFSMFGSMQEQFAVSAQQGAPDMQPFFIAVAVVSVLFAVGFSVLFGWIAKRLLSPAVVAEFRG